MRNTVPEHREHLRREKRAPAGFPGIAAGKVVTRLCQKARDVFGHVAAQRGEAIVFPSQTLRGEPHLTSLRLMNRDGEFSTTTSSGTSLVMTVPARTRTRLPTRTGPRNPLGGSRMTAPPSRGVLG